VTLNKKITNQKQLGRVGELFVALGLESLGYPTSLVDAPGCDLIVNIKNRALRIQVKSAYPSPHNKNNKRYTFSTSTGSAKRGLGRDSADIVCFVASDIRKAIFDVIPKKGMSKTKHFRLNYFKEEDMFQKTWEECLKKVTPTESS
tara:strand:+ start:3086 stop:3523 length:438 start_codon:yes stop_codon:yes gene_type:complete